MAPESGEENWSEMFAEHRRGEPTGLAPQMTSVLANAERMTLEGRADQADSHYRTVSKVIFRTGQVIDRALEAEALGDEAEALRFWKMAAALDDGRLGAKACARAGRALLADPDEASEALRYLHAGARGEDGEAHYHLGRAYFDGTGVAEDFNRAVWHFGRAVELGEVDAHHYLGAALFQGKGVAVDQAEAVRHWRLAIESETEIEPGYLFRSFPEFALGAAYHFGKGVPQDNDEAIYWYRRARANGSADERSKIDEILGGLQPEIPSGPFPLASVIVFGLSTVGTLVSWLVLTASRLPVTILWVAVSAWTLFAVAKMQGAKSRAEIRERFLMAALNPGTATKIGGVRWTISEGEFRHLAHDGGERGLLVEEDTNHAKRKAAELNAMSVRRGEFLAFLILATLAWLVVAAGFQPAFSAFIGVLALVGAGVFLRNEYGYWYGLQSIKGAMVLDPPPRQTAKDEVASQKAHGDARLADEQEARQAAAGGGQRSSAHDQIF